MVPPTADQDPALPQIEIEIAGMRRKIHLETFGDPTRPVLLLMHGGPGGDYRSIRALKALSDRYFVVVWDQRGAGLSERIGPEEISREHWLTELDVIKERYSPGRPVTLVGHSFGGVYAALYLDRSPEKVREVVLLEPGPLTVEADESSTSRLGLTSPFLQRFFWHQEFMNAPLDTQRHAELDARLKLAVETTLPDFTCPGQEEDLQVPYWRLGGYLGLHVNEQMTADPAAYRLVEPVGFTGPVLVAVGECSTFGPEQHEQFLRPLFRDIRFVTLRDVGHFFPSEKTSETLDALRGFLAEYP